jgi:hypothetical protein
MSLSASRSSLSAPLACRLFEFRFQPPDPPTSTNLVTCIPSMRLWVAARAIRTPRLSMARSTGRSSSLRLEADRRCDRFAPTGRKTQGEFGQNTRKPDRRRPPTSIPAPWRVEHAGRKFAPDGRPFEDAVQAVGVVTKRSTDLENPWVTLFICVDVELAVSQPPAFVISVVDLAVQTESGSGPTKWTVRPSWRGTWRARSLRRRTGRR